MARTDTANSVSIKARLAAEGGMLVFGIFALVLGVFSISEGSLRGREYLVCWCLTYEGALLLAALGLVVLQRHRFARPVALWAAFVGICAATLIVTDQGWSLGGFPFFTTALTSLLIAWSFVLKSRTDLRQRAVYVIGLLVAGLLHWLTIGGVVRLIVAVATIRSPLTLNRSPLSLTGLFPGFPRKMAPAPSKSR